MQNWLKFIQKIKPNGTAFRSLGATKHLFETLAYGLDLITNYAVYTLSDQIWYVNDNFNPELWERRYEINVPEYATIEERSQVVKSYMLFPQSQNRLSKDYIENSLILAGFTDIIVNYNTSEIIDGIFRINDFADETTSFVLGSKTYNTFIIEGEISESYYYDCISQVMALMPLQIGVFDKINVLNTLALNINNAIALDDDYAIAITVL